MDYHIISHSLRLTKQAAVLLSEIKKQMQPSDAEVDLNLFEIEARIGISAIQDTEWRALLLELGGKPVNYLSKQPDSVTAWLTSWTVMPGKIHCIPTKSFHLFTEEELLLLSAHSTYTSALYAILQQGLSSNELTNTDISIAELRECCDCHNKYAGFSQLKSKVIDVGVEELQMIFKREIDYAYLKNGKTIEKIRFTIQEKNNEEDGNEHEYY